MIKVLLVEASEVDARQARDMLAEAGEGDIRVTHVGNLSAALRLLNRESFDVILLYGDLIDTHGLNVLDLLQAALARMPIVMLTDQNDSRKERQAIQRGIQDVIVKQHWTAEQLVRAVRHSVDRKQAEQRLSYLAQYDPLTALANRALFRDRLIHALALAKRKKQEVGLVLMGLDQFTFLAETLGTDGCDVMLKETAERLKKCMRDVDTVARLEGDEFTCLLEGINCRADMEIVAKRILDSMAEPFKVNGEQIMVTVSIGVAVYPIDGRQVDELLQRVQGALNAVQEDGGANYQFPASGDTQA
ncbi:MAG: diguanylate cyclase response regulator [Nitrospira sp.]|nr:diguanylate cyclase response regulator [Nitrospira sp.]MDH5251855.1 diguanylate cyclase response regulator [Nitrospira sp.]